MQKELYYQYESKLHKQVIKLCHSLEISLHDNHKGPKIYTNYQRIALIVLFMRSRKSLRDFIAELYESRWPRWLGLKEIPSKSTIHNWLKGFSMSFIRELLAASVKDYEPELMAVDATGIDSWKRSRHYEKRIKQCGFREEHMPYAKADILVDTKNKLVYEHVLRMKPRHDVLGAATMLKRTKIKHVLVLGDKGYDSEPLHRIAEKNDLLLFAPVRSSPRKTPKGKHRKRCKNNPPENKGMRNIVEAVIRSLKVRINSLKCRLHFMKKREFAWHILTYNLEVFARFLKLVRWMILSSN